jgi:hypothetical protein
VKSDTLGLFLGCDHVCMQDIPVLLLPPMWLSPEILTVMDIKITVFWYMTLCSLVDMY